MLSRFWDKQRKTRNEIVAKKNSENSTLSKLNEESIRLGSAVKKTEAEVGPLRYIAEAIYGSSPDLDRAVRMVILLLVLVFDPLAVVLLIAANHGMTHKKHFTKIDTRSILRIDDTLLSNTIKKENADKF